MDYEEVKKYALIRTLKIFDEAKIKQGFLKTDWRALKYTQDVLPQILALKDVKKNKYAMTKEDSNKACKIQTFLSGKLSNIGFAEYLERCGSGKYKMTEKLSKLINNTSDDNKLYKKILDIAKEGFEQSPSQQRKLIEDDDNSICSSVTEKNFNDIDIDNDDEENDEEDNNEEEDNDFTIETTFLTNFYDKSIYDLVHMYIDKKIILQPDFQRQYVWDEKAGTLFIDSLIRKIPIPNIFCADTKDGKWEIIDGQQRVTTVLSFVLGDKFGEQDVNFKKLSASKQFDENIRGKTFGELTKDQQDIIMKTNIRVVVLGNLEKEPDMKYELFKRLNTGACRLNDMEIRKCIFRSEYFSKLEELSTEDKFKKIIGIESMTGKKKKRMEGVNVVLQFAGFKDDISNYSGSYKRWFNNLLQHEQEECKKGNFSGVVQLEKDFLNAIEGLYVVFGNEPIRRYIKEEQLLKESNGKINKTSFSKYKDDIYFLRKPNIALINTLMVNFMKYKKVEIQRKVSDIKDAIIKIQLEDEEFIESIEGQQTADKKKVFTRINKIKELLEGILENDENKRFFKKDIKAKLFRESQRKNGGKAICAICGGEIYMEKDASVDHKVPYSKGGSTSEENAQLTHIWCNSSKGNREN